MTYGKGSITRERGRYRLRMPDGKGGYRNVGSFESELAAERMRDAILVELGDAPVGAVTLAEYGERVLTRWSTAQRDIRNARSRWRLVCSAPFAGDPIATLTLIEVRDWVRGLPRQLSTRGKPLSWQTQKHAVNLLRRVLDEAREDGLIDDNPARSVRLARRQDTDELWTWLSLEELGAVLALDLTLEQRTALTVAVYQGLRQGELAALTWERVDLEGGWLVIAASWKSATKSGRVRRIPLLAPAAEALKRWRRRRDRTGLVFPGPERKVYARGYDWGWGDRRGTPDIPTRAGIARRVRFHDLRHTCASHLVSGTWGRAWTLREVGEYLGHSDESVTRRYAHLAPDALHATARATAASSMFPTEPAANLPQDVSRAAAQVLDFVRRAVRDSNARPSAPEASGNRAIPGVSKRARQVRGRFGTGDAATVVLEAVAAGRAIAQSELDALAVAALADERALNALMVLAGGEHALRAGLELADELAAARGNERADRRSS